MLTGSSEVKFYKVVGTLLYLKNIFLEADINKDGAIDLEEAARHLNLIGELKQLKSGESPKWFMEIDKNNDGLIQPLELDKDYYKGIGVNVDLNVNVEFEI